MKLNHTVIGEHDIITLTTKAKQKIKPNYEFPLLY